MFAIILYHAALYIFLVISYYQCSIIFWDAAIGIVMLYGHVVPGCIYI